MKFISFYFLEFFLQCEPSKTTSLACMLQLNIIFLSFLHSHICPPPALLPSLLPVLDPCCSLCASPTCLGASVNASLCREQCVSCVRHPICACHPCHIKTHFFQECSLPVLGMEGLCAPPLAELLPWFALPSCPSLPQTGNGKPLALVIGLYPGLSVRFCIEHMGLNW